MGKIVTKDVLQSFITNYYGTTAISSIGDGTATGAISSLDKRVTTAESDISQLQTDYANEIHPYDFYGGGILLIGDSYCVNSNTSLSPGWSDGEGFGKILATHFKGTLYNYSQSGIGFSDYNSSVNFLTRLQSAVSALGSSKRDTIKLVLFAGGANDGDGDGDTIYTRMQKCLQIAHTNFVNARCCCAFIGWSRNGKTVEYFNRARELWTGNAEAVGMPMLKGTEWAIHHWDRVGTDNLHPSSTGQKYIARYLKSALLNHSACTYREDADVGNIITRSDGIVDFNNGASFYVCTMNDGVATLCFPKISYGYGTNGYKNITMDGQTEYTIGNIHSFMTGGYFVSTVNSTNVSADCVTWDAIAKVYINNKSYNEAIIPACMILRDGILGVSFVKTDGGLAETLSISGFDIYSNSVTRSLSVC